MTSGSPWRGNCVPAAAGEIPEHLGSSSETARGRSCWHTADSQAVACVHCQHVGYRQPCAEAATDSKVQLHSLGELSSLRGRSWAPLWQSDFHCLEREQGNMSSDVGGCHHSYVSKSIRRLVQVKRQFQLPENDTYLYIFYTYTDNVAWNWAEISAVIHTKSVLSTILLKPVLLFTGRFGRKFSNWRKDWFGFGHKFIW